LQQFKVKYFDNKTKMWDAVFNVGFVFVLGAILYHLGYVDRAITAYYARKKQAELLFSVVKTLQGKHTHDDSIAFSINDSDLSATILYKRLGHEYMLMVPFNRDYVAGMSQFRAKLFRHNKSPIDITQQPGIPYLVSAHDLGGTHIEITNHETGATHSYSSATVPLYAAELLHEE
jgi:hypothetical protein